MAKKKKEDFKEKMFGVFNEILFGKLKDQIINIVKDASNKIHKSIVDAGTTVIKLLFSSFLILLGFIMLIISFIYLSKDIFQITFGQSMFIWSVILMLFGIFYALISTKKKEREY